jgi:hypothetical protein
VARTRPWRSLAPPADWERRLRELWRPGESSSFWPMPMRSNLIARTGPYIDQAEIGCRGEDQSAARRRSAGGGYNRLGHSPESGSQSAHQRCSSKSA